MHLQKQVLAKGLGTVVTAWHSGAAIAASIFCHVGKSALYKYGASDPRFQHLRGNTLVMWEAIRYYVENGYDQLSLGRTDVPHAGLRRFKLGWGAEETTVAYFRYDLHRGGFVGGQGHRSEAGYGFLKLMPLSCLRRLGSMLYKHIA
jgi:lipid II:glycine glycyltransferase (peptidoglycan interpeptide bridge formation enzyme)